MKYYRDYPFEPAQFKDGDWIDIDGCLHQKSFVGVKYMRIDNVEKSMYYRGDTYYYGFGKCDSYARVPIFYINGSRKLVGQELLDVKRKCLSLSHGTFVYVFKAEGTNYYKIGWSKIPATRLEAIQPHMPHKLILIYEHQAEKEHEVNLHSLFRHKRIRGEWFNLDDSDIYYIDRYFKNIG